MTRRQLLALFAPPEGAGLARIRVPALVAKGEPSSLEATVDGKPARVELLKGPQDDLLILLVLDFSGDISYIEFARSGLVEAFKELPPHAWVTVLRAQDGLRVLEDPTGAAESLTATVNAYTGGGKAGLLDTVEEAAQLGDRLLVKTTARVAVLYCTDSSIYNYREDFTNPVINSSDSRDLSRRFPDQLVREKIQKLTGALLARETPVWIVHIHYRVDSINEAYQRGLQQLAEATGGEAAICRGLTEIPAAIGRAFRRIREHWSVFLQLPPGKSRNLSVALNAPDCEMSFRQRFSVKR
ncbi:MAG: hypothetical protein INH43_13445 [Acidobacteriaceae bacterium]|nr:hypothetical protein [Acidobacteriaceae bacterium]